MSKYIATLDNGHTILLEAENAEDAKVQAQESIKGLELAEVVKDTKLNTLEKLPDPKPDNTVEERSNGWYFSAWGIEVAKTSVVVKEKLVFKKDENGEKQAVLETFEEKVPVAETLAEAKAHIKEHFGNDVDKDIPPSLGGA